jgi:hypothetical protein
MKTLFLHRLDAALLIAVSGAMHVQGSVAGICTIDAGIALSRAMN